MKFIENWFEINFDEDKITYKNINNIGFENLKYRNIKDFKSYPEVYNFLYEVQELLNNGYASIENDELVLPVCNFMQQIEQNDNDKFQYNLTLKTPLSYGLKIRSLGDIKYGTFNLNYEILEKKDRKYEKCEIIGCFAKKKNGDEYYLLDKHLYSLFQSIKNINKIAKEDNEYELWNSIDKLKKQSVFTDSVISGFFSNEDIIIPSLMSVELSEDENNFLKITPSLDGLTEEEQEAFHNQYKMPDALDTYSFIANGQKKRIVINPQIKENIEQLKKLPKTIRNKGSINKIISNPVGLLPNREVVSIENLSDRIVNFGEYKALSGSLSAFSQGWADTFIIKLYDVSGQLIDFKINDKEEKSEFVEQLEEAIAYAYSFFIFNNITIPLTPQNYVVLKNFIRDIDKQSLKRPGDKIIKKVLLKNDKDEVKTINITQDLFNDLKTQIQEIRECNIEDGMEFCISIYNEKYPLTKENIKQIKEVFAMHFLIDENDRTCDFNFDELMFNYYNNASFEQPKSLKPTVKYKEHQKKGIAWLQTSFKMHTIGREGVLLADDMGLGKTLQILSFILWLNDKEEYSSKYFSTDNKKPVLIVAPVILLENWKNEYYKFFYDTLDEPFILHGDNLRDLKIAEGKEYIQEHLSGCNAELKLDIKEIKEHNIVITNYETLVNYEFSFASIDWSVIVLDEAQAIKETSSNKSRVVKGLKADFRIACTGTPVENCLVDLWNIFDFLQHNLLGSRQEFKEAYPSDDMTEEKYNEIRERLFYEKPFAYVLRREKRTDLKDALPQKYIKEPFKVPLTQEQVDKFEELKQQMNFVNSGEEKLKAFANMNKLSQHPRLLSNIDTNDVNQLIFESNKFKKLIEIIETNIKPKNEKVIIFCVFRDIQKYLKMVLEDKFEIDNIDIINGEAGNRQTLIDNFQKEKNKFGILILSPLAAGVGLNITGANHVIHYGRWWNPAKENQATDRAYRIGQQKDVYVYYLIDVYPNSSDKTFDQNLHELIMKKIELATNFLQPNDIEISTDELEKCLISS